MARYSSSSRHGTSSSSSGLFPRLTTFASLLLFISITVLCVVLAGFLHLPRTLRQSQSCRMSRMWPSYVPHHDQVVSPSGLSQKYSLYLYRERPPGFRDPSLDLPSGRPALFVPGNAGSYGQVRSVASSAHNAYFVKEADPSGGVREEWRGTPEMDWWTVDFNEDFSAFHGSTMQEQAIFLNEVLLYLRSVYSSIPDLRIPILAHSMGGIVSRLMLELDNHPNGTVDTLVTLSSPHAYPPVPFDPVVEDVYRVINDRSRKDAEEAQEIIEAIAIAEAKGDKDIPSLQPPPHDLLIISLSGGVLDTQLPSEPSSLSLSQLFRPDAQLTGFTTALPALWSSVDHLAMMWCDQIRERIARGFMRDVSLHRGEDRRGLRGLRKRRELWRRAIGVEPQEDGQALFDSENAVANLPLLGEGGVLTSPLESGTRLLDVDVDDSSEGSFEIVTNLAVGPDPTMLPPIDQPMPLRILFCVPSVGREQDKEDKEKETQAETETATATCHPALPWHYEILPIDSSPRAEQRYEDPSIGLRRLSVEAKTLKGQGVKWIKIMADVREDSEPKDDATIKGWSGRGWVKFGWSPPPRIIRSHPWPSSLTFFPLQFEPAPKKDRMDPDPTPTPFLSRFFLPRRDSTIVAYRYELQASFCGQHQLARRFKPILKVEHPGTGDAHWRADLPTKDKQTFVFALHGSSPLIQLPSERERGALVSLWTDTGPSEDGCAPFDSLRISVAWRASAGLLLSRYRTSLAALPLSYVTLSGIPLLTSPGTGEATSMTFHRQMMKPKLVALFLLAVPTSQLIASLILSLAPSRGHVEEVALGLHNFDLWQIFGVGLTLGIISIGLALLVGLFSEVAISIWAILLGRFRIVRRRMTLNAPPGRAYDLMRSLTMILFLVPIYIWVPYQVAFILAFLYHLFTTFRSRLSLTRPSSIESARFQQNLWLLNVLIWLLPLHALVVLVWIRNLSVGWRAPLGGSDHNPLRIAPILVLVQIMAGGGVLKQRGTKLERLATKTVLSWLIALGLFRGIRHTYILGTISNVIFASLALLHWRGVHLPPLPNSDYTNGGGSTGSEGAESLPMDHVDVASRAKVRFSDGTSHQEYRAFSMLPEGIEAPDLEKARRMAEVGQGHEDEDEADTHQQDEEEEELEEELLERYLSLVDRYSTCRAKSNEALAKAFFELSRARMQLGPARGFTSLGKDGWDARSRARLRIVVEVEGDGDGVGVSEGDGDCVGVSEGDADGEGKGKGRRIGLREVGEEELRREREEEGGGPSLIVVGEDEKEREREGGTSMLRQRRRGAMDGEAQRTSSSSKPPTNTGTMTEEKQGVEEDPKKAKASRAQAGDDVQGQVEKKSTLAPDPLYQFAALPPPSLRNSQALFREALRWLMDGSRGQGERERERESSLGLLDELRRVEGRLVRLRERQRERMREGKAVR